MRHQFNFTFTVKCRVGHHTNGMGRSPLKFGITPLYMSYLDVWNIVQAIVDVMAFEKWDNEQLS